MTPSLDQPAGSRQTIRLPRPAVIVLCGPAACGKSTFAARHFRPTQIISSDHARALVCDDERDQRFQTQAFALVHFLVEQRLEIKRLCVVDSTALTPAARKNLLNLARKYQAPCIVLLFKVPLEKCLARDAARERTVGQAVIERQCQLFEQAAASLRDEGFDQVVEIADADMDGVHIEIVFRPPARKPEPDKRVGPRLGERHTVTPPSAGRGPGATPPGPSAVGPRPQSSPATPQPPGTAQKLPAAPSKATGTGGV